MEQTMTAELVERLADLCENRAHAYAFFERCFEREMDAALVNQIREEGFFESGDELMGRAFATLVDDLNDCDEEGITDLACAFNRVFFGMGPRMTEKAFPYESVYTSEDGLMMQDAYSEVLILYRRFGFEKREDFPEPEDHIAVELSFMDALAERTVQAAHALDGEKAEELLRTQRDFLHRHLMNWISRFTVDAHRADVDGFYDHLCVFMNQFLAADAKMLDELLGEETGRDDYD